MAKIVIFTTPTSITIRDANQNTLVVRKGETSIEFHSSVDSAKASKNILVLQTLIKDKVTAKTKDSYKARFDRLKAFFNNVNTHSFVTLTNQLVKQ